MGYTVSTSSAASQAEGNPGAAATFVYTITRLAGDIADGDAVSFTVRNADFSPSNDFTVASGSGITVGGGSAGFAGGTTATFTLTSTADSTIEPDETFQISIYRNSDPGNPFYTGSVTLTNDDVLPVFSTPTAISIAENTTAVETAVASGPSVVYTKTGGADQAAFNVSAGGVVTFAAGPDFEAGTGHGTTVNDYLLQITATSGGQATVQNLTVSVTNVDDVPVGAIGGAAAPHINENTTTVGTYTATTDAASTATTWSISGGADASAFAINASTGVLSFVTAPDREHPTDVGTNNVYDVIVKATDSAGLFNTKAVAVTVDDVAEGPVITSNGGGALSIIHFPENIAITSAITTVTATAAESGTGTAVVYAIAGGDDAAAFSISAGGVLTINSSPNYEAPVDTGADNVYQVNVSATSSGITSTQSLYLFVDNVVEPGDPVTVTPPGGGTVIPPVTPPANQVIIGTAFNENFTAGTGNDTIDGGTGNDSIDGGSGNNSLQGGDGADFIRGFDGNDTVDGGTGNDDVNGNVGNDSVSGGDGADTVRGGQGDDTVSGGEGDDPHVNGNLGNDIVHGDNGNDTVYGGQGSDTIYGDAGNDQLSGDLGNDILFGGPGADRFMFAKGGGQDWVGDFNAAEGDHIVLAPGTTFTVTNFGGQVLIDLGGGDTIGLAGVPFASYSSAWVIFS